MKFAFFICRIFSFCFIIVFICSSCTSYLIVNGGEHVPKNVTIYVTGYDTTGHLTLEDASQHSADPFTAYPGQTVRWKISGIRHFVIDNIVEKPGKTQAGEAFAKKPHPVPFFSKSWKGTLKVATALQGIAFVSDSSGRFIHYIYKIAWHKAGHHTFDPEIQIKLP